MHSRETGLAAEMAALVDGRIFRSGAVLFWKVLLYALTSRVTECVLTLVRLVIMTET